MPQSALLRISARGCLAWRVGNSVSQPWVQGRAAFSVVSIKEKSCFTVPSLCPPHPQETLCLLSSSSQSQFMPQEKSLSTAFYLDTDTFLLWLCMLVWMQNLYPGRPSERQEFSKLPTQNPQAFFTTVEFGSPVVRILHPLHISLPVFIQAKPGKWVFRKFAGQPRAWSEASFFNVSSMFSCLCY